MRLYNDNKDIKKEIEIALTEKELNKADIARILNTSRQQITNTFNKKNLSFIDVKRICEAMGCDLYVDIRSKDKE